VRAATTRRRATPRRAPGRATEAAPAPAGETTPPSTPTETTPAGDDEPVSIEATITGIEQSGGSDDPADQDAGITILSVDPTEGEPRRVLIPPDVTLDQTAARVLRDPACAGKVLANLEIVDAPPQETLGDAILVSAQIDTESC
jgi:hypothetical protein